MVKILLLKGQERMETVLHSEGKIACIRNKLLYFAVVHLEIRFPAEETSILMACHGRGFVSQGYIEEVPEKGYDDWKQGALAGIAYALATCVDRPCQVTVTKIEGLSSDTNPTIVGDAAIQALWSAMQYTPSREQMERVDQLVFQSFSHPVDYLPEFHV
jgi:hypothetical protein